MDVYIQEFSFSGTEFDYTSDAKKINITAAAGYFHPTITHLADRKYFLTWAEGANPDFMLKARFVDFDTN